MADYTKLPENLPVPVDDGACGHLEGMMLPSIALEATSGGLVDLSKLPGLVVVFCYPRTAVPGGPVDPNMEAWDLIPGARGCSVQACTFRDQYSELSELNVQIFGLSTQKSSEQYEVISRLHLPFTLLSDVKHAFTQALKLPTFVWLSNLLIKRNTIVIQGGKIIKVFYPVFPPNENAKNVVKFLKELKNTS